MNWGLGLEHEFMVVQNGIAPLCPHKIIDAVAIVDNVTGTHQKHSTYPRIMVFTLKHSNVDEVGEAKPGNKLMDLCASDPILLALPRLFPKPEPDREFSTLQTILQQDWKKAVLQSCLHLSKDDADAFFAAIFDFDREVDAACLDRVEAAIKDAKHVKQARKACYSIAQTFLQRLGDPIHDGTVIICTSYLFQMYNLFPRNQQSTDQQRTQVLNRLADIFRIRSASIYVQTDNPSKEQPIEVDGYFVEVKSTLYKKQTVHSILQQVVDAERRVLSVTGCGSQIFPYSGLVELASAQQVQLPLPVVAVADQGAATGTTPCITHLSSVHLPYYAGSYHVWITLPHDRRLYESSTVERSRLSRAHALLAHRLQWVEPLLMSIMGGDPRALGAGLQYARASMRSVFNPLSGYGTTNPLSLLHVEYHHLTRGQRGYLCNKIGMYFNQAEDAQDQSRGKMMTDTTEVGGLWVNITGSWEPFQTCFNIGRLGGYANYGFVSMSHTLDPGTVQSKQTLYNIALHNMGAGYNIGTGNDIRQDECGRVLGLPLQAGWKPAWVAWQPGSRLSKAAGLHLALHFYKPAKNGKGLEVKQVAPVDWQAAKKDDAVGFEFRVMDNCPSADMVHILRMVALLAASADETSRGSSLQHCVKNLTRDQASQQKAWGQAIASVSCHGCFTHLSSDYVRRMWGVCLGKAPPANVLKPEATAYSTLVRLCEALHDEFDSHPVSTLMQGKSASRHRVAPVPVNRNFEVWQHAFEAHPISGQADALADILQGRRPEWLPDIPYIEHWFTSRLEQTKNQ